MASFRIRHLRTINELNDYKKKWEILEVADESSSIFQSWEWNHQWCKDVLPTLKRARIDVQIIEDEENNILAILPFFETSMAGAAVKLIQFIGHRMSFHNDVLLVNPKSTELAKQVLSTLIKGIGPRSIMHLRHLNADSVFTKQLLVNNQAQIQCPRILIEADPLIEDQLLRLRRSTRKKFRYKRNRLRREFEVKFHIRKGNDFPDAFDELIELHHKRFSEKKRSTLLVGPALKFLRNITSKLSNTGAFEILQVQANGITIGAKLAAIDKEHYCSIMGGFDPEFGRFSLGKLMEFKQIRRGFDELKCKACDFGPGYELHKFDWGPNTNIRNYFCCIGGRGFYAKLMATIYCMIFKYKLPTIPNYKVNDHVTTNKPSVKSIDSDLHNQKA